LLALLKVVEPQIEELDKAVADEPAGVGPLIALAFVLTIGEVARFAWPRWRRHANSRDVRKHNHGR
jgi:hypothetical protein